MNYEGYANAECPIAIRQLPKQPFFFLLRQMLMNTAAKRTAHEHKI